ncbi:MAG TPA: nucleoside triphosphate pyrophosphatase [Gemmataceae bacterium]|nr:nucleoside triphosphate pyrophosphatase [Gemmataceae bacterium]
MAERQPSRLILASASWGRRQLLEQAGYHFEVSPSHVDEPTGEGIKDIRGFVQHVSWLKAAAVAPHFENAIILAADSVGWIDGQVIAKPADRDDARRILRLLRGRDHELWTGVILWRRPDNIQLAWQECSRVAFKALGDHEIETYLETRMWEGCSGAYAVQGLDDPYVRVVEGTVSNVVGLPIETLEKLLGDFRLQG